VCCGCVLEVLAQALHDEGYLDLQETFNDGSFAPAKQGGAGVGKTKRGKGSKIMAIADRRGLAVAVQVESATPHEVTLVHATLAQRFVKPFPVRLIGDNAYESDRLFAWFQNFRRLVVRYERYAENFLAMLQLACCLILVRGL
jgi:IS5 family transposase